MRVAMLAPISWRVPPRHYGPWERVVSLLTECLLARGVAVTLFATADSITDAALAGPCPRPYSEDDTLDPKVWECLHISEVFERAGEFDLIHNHFDFLPLSYSALVDTPVVTTIHGFSSPRILPVFEKYNASSYYVSISDADRSPKLDYVATVHHGIALDEFTLRKDSDGSLLFFGRIHPEKAQRKRSRWPVAAVGGSSSPGSFRTGPISNARSLHTSTAIRFAISDPWAPTSAQRSSGLRMRFSI